MLKPLEQWYCDVCDGVVEIKGGYVLWDYNNPSEEDKDKYRIVHQGKCDANKVCSSLPIEEFLGTDGLAKILCEVDVGEIFRGHGKHPEPSENLDYFFDFFRRVQLPYYEEARLYFAKAWQDDHDFNYYVPVGPYLKDNLKGLIEKYSA